MCPPQKKIQNSLPWQCAKTVILTQIVVHSLRIFFHVSLLFPQQAAVTQQTFICSSVSVTHNVCQSLPLRNQKIKKKQKKQTHGMEKICWVGVCHFFFFLVFSRFFLLLMENLKNPEKTKKNKMTHPNPPDLLHPMGLFFLFFLVFSRFLLLFMETKKHNAVQYSDYHIRI